MKKKPSEITVPKRFRQDYGDLKDLGESITAFGLIAPVIISKDGVLADGGRRLKAWKLVMGDEPIPVAVYEGEGSEKDIEAEVDRTHKKFDLDELYALGLYWEKVYAPTRKVGKPASNDADYEATPTDDLVAKRLGMSKSMWQRLKWIKDPTRLKEVEKEDVQVLINIQNEMRQAYADRSRGINSAYAKIHGLIYPPKKGKIELQGEVAKLSMDVLAVTAKLQDLPSFKYTPEEGVDLFCGQLKMLVVAATSAYSQLKKEEMIHEDKEGQKVLSD